MRKRNIAESRETKLVREEREDPLGGNCERESKSASTPPLGVEQQDLPVEDVVSGLGNHFLQPQLDPQVQVEFCQAKDRSVGPPCQERRSGRGHTPVQEQPILSDTRVRSIAVLAGVLR